MKISVGRSGKDIGEYEWEYVRDGLKKGLFLPSDFGWYAGLAEWQPLVEVLRSLEFLYTKKPVKPARIPKGEKWRGEEPSEKQINMLKRAGVPLFAGMTKGRASDLIAALPEAYRSLTGKQINDLKSAGYDLNKTSLHECRLVLEKLR